jgi:hypothetical protein
MDDETLNRRIRDITRIDLRKAGPFTFWFLGSVYAGLKVNSVDLDGDTLRLQTRRFEGSTGTFWLDLQRRVVLRSVIDGVPWSAPAQ